MKRQSTAHSTRKLPLFEQPTQRVLTDSAACSTAELLAALIGGPRPFDAAMTLLAKFDSAAGLLSADAAEIADVSGLGLVSAARLKAALALGCRALNDVPPRAPVTCPEDAAHLLRPSFMGKEQEYLYVLMLDVRQRQLRQPVEVYHGSLNAMTIRVGELFRDAIRWNAASIIVAHNHPSGDESPSPEDVSVTKLVVEAGKLLDVTVNDHLIFGAGNRFTSLKRRGLGFT